MYTSLPAVQSLRAGLRRYNGATYHADTDDLAIEEPLQIRLAGEDVAVTMRTPGYDEELAAGFLFTEGVIKGKDDIEAITYCLSDDGAEPNIINVLPADRKLLQPGAWGRSFISSSSCGLCGKTSIEQVKGRVAVARQEWTAPASLLYALPEKLRAAQETFAQTGGLHAAGLFTRHGELLLAREDVGRHNAVDKIIGHALLHKMLPLQDHILLVSSRASFEIVQKALHAGISFLAVVSAPSSLAVRLALNTDMTLVAFLRGERMNVYSGEGRVIA